MEETVLTVSNVKKHYPILVSGRGLYQEKRLLKAVDGVSFSIRKGETFGLAGESGCGKTTLAKIIAKLRPVTEGRILYGDVDVTHFSRKETLPLRRRVQIIFQDPYSSLNPRKTARELLAAPLDAMNLGTPEERENKVREMMDLVGLNGKVPDQYPRELSGGQRQRIAIARAMISDPDLVVCDEPVSALDVSVRGQILRLMRRFQRERGVSYLFISRDFASLRYLCDRVAVMYLGKIVEQGSKRDIFEHPAHPYTKALLSASAISVAVRRKDNVLLRGDAANSVYVPSGCAFRTRCPYATQGCSKGEHPLTPLRRPDGASHSSSCPRYRKDG